MSIGQLLTQRPNGTWTGGTGSGTGGGGHSGTPTPTPTPTPTGPPPTANPNGVPIPSVFPPGTNEAMLQNLGIAGMAPPAAPVNPLMQAFLDSLNLGNFPQPQPNIPPPAPTPTPTPTPPPGPGPSHGGSGTPGGGGGMPGGGHGDALRDSRYGTGQHAPSMQPPPPPQPQPPMNPPASAGQWGNLTPEQQAQLLGLLQSRNRNNVGG
jgi:hypothetical protein